MDQDPTELSRRWQEAASTRPAARRFLSWAQRLLDAAMVSQACGLTAQADHLADKARVRLEAILAQPSTARDKIELTSGWNPDGLAPNPARSRQEALWRRVRLLRAHRQPFRGEGHPEFRGLAWGPYNRQSSVAEALSAAAKVDPLWVDDFLERERSLRLIDGLLGLGAA
ncbi:MAG: hypothetical protein IPK50_21340 [Fibrobacterota bacterium]|nr:hypothetical protein [Fibrobacterota bacterium]QQS04795.1 MAG: hypothetical protein IPK50_21340 [Fibrobacterota bacterium]